MKKHLIILTALIYSLILKSQVITVKDQITHKPVAFAVIYSKNPELSTLTDTRGRADIAAFSRSDSIYIRYMGYQPKLRSYSELEAKRFIVYLKPSDINIDEVVISASKWKQEKKEVPQKIVTVKPIDVILENPLTAADMLGSTGEVYIQKSQLGGGSPIIRGFAANRVLISVDGVRMNNAIFRSGNLQNVISLDPFAIRTTEVIFGPGSIIYGSDAIGGVMSFYTLDPVIMQDKRFFIKGNSTIRYSSASNEKTGHLDLNYGYKKWSFISSVTFSDFDDLKMGSNGPNEYLRPEYATRIHNTDTVIRNPDPEKQLFTGYSQLNLMQKIRFCPNKKADFIYGAHYSVTTDIPRYDRLIEYKNGKLRDGEWYYGPQKWSMNSLSLNYKADNMIFDNLYTVFAYQLFEESRHNRSFGKSSLTHRTENVQVVTANLDLNKSVNNKLQLHYGSEIMLNYISSSGIDEDIVSGSKTAGSTRYPDGSTMNSFALYLTSKYKYTNKIILHTGLRYNLTRLDARFDTGYFHLPFTAANLSKGALTGSTGIVYNPVSSLSVTLNFSTGFRSPNIDDIGKVFDSEPGMVVVPNPGLKHEYAYNAELSVAKIFQDILKCNVSGYFTYLHDALVRRDFQLNGKDSIFYDGEMSRIQAIQNAANARVWGIQAGADLKLPAGFGLNARVNYQKGKEELDDGSVAPLRHASPLFGSIHLTFTTNRFKTSLYTVFNGKIDYENLAPSEQIKPHLYAIDENGKPYSPLWYTLNLKAVCQFTDYISVSTGIENLTNQRYRMYSSGITAPGMNFIISLRTTF